MLAQDKANYVSVVELCVNLGKITHELILERHRHTEGRRAGSQQRHAMLVSVQMCRTLRNETGLEVRRRSRKAFHGILTSDCYTGNMGVIT